MFVALRDLRAARGRFALITLVVTLVALLVSFLSGLTAGLAHQNISAVDSIDADAVVFADTGADPSFDTSALTEQQIALWQQAGGSVDPIGISRARATSATGAAPSQVALFGADGNTFGNRTATEPGTVVLSDGAASALDAGTGDPVDLGGHTFTVAAVHGDDWYSHTPVVWMTLPDWQSVSPRSGAATVLAVSDVRALDAVNAAAHTTTTTPSDALSAIGSYEAENGSLTVMTLLLFAISALVIGAFFTVWTIQRLPDIATLKALGATSASLVRDALTQAAIVLTAGVAAGLAITVAAASLMGDALPFVVSPSTTLLPAAALILLGLGGAAFALRFLFTTDPLTALGAAR
ncbi:ABC transporter permease [Nocardia cyriacigeorgica]|uniref:ABC transporter permease n=1 Tax=Nocardia cyriacigeorgica TaxID=135487 RepID=A0A6P1D906_9NOCA|nr:ABC transporter permease [Nocardia cyriacigeorgica]NEW41893.1 ABC transporter permease [Nocardia cyriacigeorgica]NEW46129.1 ABC transporter permease [Nocardia cyriacigeorgica]NEW52256.1 ABC transporter permease [Nocardia cyriacigeorgica]NEW57586.1 ABC transporter permease [Nocardia cyriacigeorgica]